MRVCDKLCWAKAQPTFIYMFFGMLFFLGLPSWSDAQTTTPMQLSLKELDKKIDRLQKTLSITHHQQQQLQEELNLTERLIKDNTSTLKDIETHLPLKQQAVDNITQQIKTSTQQFHELQALLMHQIQMRYKYSHNQPLEWLFMHTKKTDMDRLLTYYQYILRMDAKTLTQLKTTQLDLKNQEVHLKEEVTSLQQLQTQRVTHHQYLKKQQEYHQTLLVTLKQQINQQEKTLSLYQQDRKNLTKILEKLARESKMQTRLSMSRMQHKLPSPITANGERIQKLNQGIFILSPENSPVHAIYPGKVVFCEWLNGYGLLLILDHGWGLMTLYANNQTLLKQKGDIVSQGEQIASVGHSGVSRKSGLYFELRKHGKPVSPLSWIGFNKNKLLS